MVRNLGRPFCRILDSTFFGDVLNNSILGSPTIFQKMVRNLGRLFCRILGSTFSGDVLNNWILGSPTILQKMVRNLQRPFCRILDSTFSGDVLNNPFQRDGAESFAANGWSKSCESRFAEFLIRRFPGMF